RYDGARISAWLVNWADPEQRILQFAGEIGEMVRAGGAFRAELRGLTEMLNLPQGRVYQHACSAVLGDAACGFDINNAGYSTEVSCENVTDSRVFLFSGLGGFDARWFEAGTLHVLSGDGAGLVGVIKNDRQDGHTRRIELWESLRVDVWPGDKLRLVAGCDKRAE
ncbi:DUF2163 domain-containing protein, partial [Escherichia coli]|nr:DUF2163 domain-containing protein [Escherichia coli]